MTNQIEPEAEDEIEFNCPRCDSTKVLVSLDSQGHYEVRQCHECGYKID